MHHARAKIIEFLRDTGQSNLVGARYHVFVHHGRE